MQVMQLHQDCHLIFEQILGELSDLHGLVAYSLFQLPENAERRQNIYQRVLQQTKSLHFAVEGLNANTALSQKSSPACRTCLPGRVSIGAANRT